MTIDLNQAEEQKESFGPIPPDSMVLVRVTLLCPKNNNGQSNFVGLSDSGYQFLTAELEVLSGSFIGKKFRENLGVAAATDKGMQGVQIAMRKIRAMVEASRGINPKDQSPAALQSRKLSDWRELDQMFFGIVVGVQKPKPGDRYVNNEIKKVITPDHEFYATVMQGGEFISDKPVPEIPQAAGGPSPSWAAPGTQTPNAAPAAPVAPRQGNLTAPGAATFQAPAANQAPPVQQQYAPPAQQQYQQPPANGVPNVAWAQPQPGQGGAFPTEASGMDQVPFN
ncbi:MAG: hypothetical protein FD177_1034 [Desulfovibrionaceae bacterium]|nr:MAG: hypothetical protein FD177_1034 [Desulfovibrionaceae bacterium]